MVLSAVLCLALLGSPGAQDPFQPLDLGKSQGTLTKAGAREDWVRTTNQRLELSHRPLRVAMEGLTAIVLAPGVEKPRHAKPILLGRGEHELLFRSIVAMGFNRIVVRNPDSGKEWAARLDQGKATIE